MYVIASKAVRSLRTVFACRMRKGMRQLRDTSAALAMQSRRAWRPKSRPLGRKLNKKIPRQPPTKRHRSLSSMISRLLPHTRSSPPLPARSSSRTPTGHLD